MNWVFKVDSTPRLAPEQDFVFSITQKRNFRGSANDRVLLLSPFEDTWAFVAEAMISQKKEDDVIDGYRKFVVTLSKIKIFEEARELDTFSYSLPKVYNFQNPFKHFARQYSRLSDEEFATILEDQIYVARTVLGTVLNSLHKEHQEEFIAHLASVRPEALVSKVDIDGVTSVLLDYLNYSIIEPCRYLLDSQKILTGILPSENLDRVGFSSTAEGSQNGLVAVNLIGPQVSIIS